MNKERLYKVLVSPRISEKSTMVGDSSNYYVFDVVPDATKPEIKAAVEMLWEGVSVLAVQTANIKGKSKRFSGRPGKRNDVRKAYVRLAEGQEIDFTAYKAGK